MGVFCYSKCRGKCTEYLITHVHKCLVISTYLVVRDRAYRQSPPCPLIYLMSTTINYQVMCKDGTTQVRSLHGQEEKLPYTVLLYPGIGKGASKVYLEFMCNMPLDPV